MNVRKAAATSIWLIIVFVGVPLLLSVLWYRIPSFFMIAFSVQETLQYYIGGFYPQVLSVAMWAAIIVGTLNAIMNNHRHLALLNSYVVVIIMTIPVIIATFIPWANLLIFCGVLQIIAIIATYWSFRKLIRNNRSTGQKMVGYIKEIRRAGSPRMAHASDHFIVWIASFALVVLFMTQLVTLGVFVFTNRSELLSVFR